jgi:hypothetical protein
VNYETELSHQVQASNLLIAALREIQRKLDIVMCNRSQEEYNSPFANTGNHFYHALVPFEVDAYSWDETSEQDYNFKWRDIRISWYKYLGRLTYVNVELTSVQIEELLKDCLAGLNKFNEETKRRDEENQGKDQKANTCG